MAKIALAVVGLANWPTASLKDVGIASSHQGHQAEIEITSPTTAKAIFAMTDRLWFPEGSPVAKLTGYGQYHETYEKQGGAWKIKTLLLTRYKVEGVRS